MINLGQSTQFPDVIHHQLSPPLFGSNAWYVRTFCVLPFFFEFIQLLFFFFFSDISCASKFLRYDKKLRWLLQWFVYDVWHLPFLWKYLQKWKNCALWSDSYFTLNSVVLVPFSVRDIDFWIILVASPNFRKQYDEFLKQNIW